MFTDWTRIDPCYFYGRGVLFGAIVTNIIWLVIIPMIKKRFGRGLK